MNTSSFMVNLRSNEVSRVAGTKSSFSNWPLPLPRVFAMFGSFLSGAAALGGRFPWETAGVPLYPRIRKREAEFVRAINAPALTTRVTAVSE